MSLDSSLKTQGNLAQHRSVLKRHERLEKMQETKGYDPKTQPVVGMPKTTNRKSNIGR